MYHRFLVSLFQCREPLTAIRTSSTECTTKAVPPAARIFRIVDSCNFVALPLSVLTSNAKKCPLMQAMMSGIPAVPYIPPCSFQQKHPGTVLRYFIMDFTISDSFILFPPTHTEHNVFQKTLMFTGLEHMEHQKSHFYIDFSLKYNIYRVMCIIYIIYREIGISCKSCQV